MQKRWAATAVLVLLLAALTGCRTEPKPLRICLDLAYVGGSTSKMVKQYENFMEDVSVVYGNGQDIIVEAIPRSGERREEAIKQIHWEMENGGGPDLFIISNATALTVGDSALFPFPEQAMENGAFLTLDKYIENAEFMEWDKQTQVIMEAGRTKEGQQIMPLSYTIPVTCFRKALVKEEDVFAETWSDMLQPDNEPVQASAIWLHKYKCFYPQWEGDYLENILGVLADYSTGELLFTEEELLQRIREIAALAQLVDADAYFDIPSYYQVCMNVGYTDLSMSVNINASNYNAALYSDIEKKEALTMVPIYSDDGGVTATIKSYAAINANTNQPENTFLYMDYLMSEMMQQSSDFYSTMLEGVGVPVQENLLREGVDLRSGIGRWSLTEENSEEFQRVVDQVTYVRFRNPLEKQLDELYQACHEALENDESIEELVSEAYAQMEAVVGGEPVQ